MKPASSLANVRSGYLFGPFRQLFLTGGTVAGVFNFYRCFGLKRAASLRTQSAIRREVRYYLSGLDEPSSAFQNHIRKHWSIENSCHLVLDTTFREDYNQTYIGNAASNLGALRRIVLNLLKLDLYDTRSLPKKRRNAMLDPTDRESLLSLA